MGNKISKIIFSALFVIVPALSFAQFSFTASNAAVMAASHYHSGCTVTVADWNSDGLDDIIVLDQAHNCYVERQNSDGHFTTIHIGDFTGFGSAWGMAAGDFDQNGFLDVVAGNGSVKIFMCDANGAMGTAITLPLTSIFLQNVTLGDFNNDGWLDIYGCHDVGESKIWLNDGTGNFPAPVEFTGNISGNTLTVTAMINGTIPLGFYLSGTGVYSNTKIVAYGTGTGGVGTYTLSNSSTVASTDMIAKIFNTNVSGTGANVGAVGNDDSGNYGTTWSDFDMDGDLDFYVSKCRQVAAVDMRRHDVLHINDGTYHYNADFDDVNINDQDSVLLDLYCPDHNAETWTTNFGDFDNDGDFDLLRTSYTEISELWENDGTGHFTDITVSSNFDIGTLFQIESQIEDFDNDGFQDIILTGDREIFFRNNGNMTFTKYDNTILPGQLGSFATGDLNHDGFIDVYACYNSIYVNPGSTDDEIFLNDGNANHWLTFNLVGTVSNKGAIGANIKLYTPLGIQVREVRAGESYGTENSFNLHFGLGTNTTVDSAIIRYPSGIVNKLYNLTVDQFITNVETGCTVQSGVITYTGSTTICPGQHLTLTAPAGYSYVWFNGATTQSVDVTNSGTYTVQVSNGSCAVNTPPVQVINDSQNAPVISTLDALKVCAGSSITLNSTPAASYSWSNGDTTQTITVTQGGTYNVTVPGSGICPFLTSNDIVLNVIDVTEPVGTDDYIFPNNSANLQATGTDVHWFDQATAGTELGTGNNFTTPVIAATTTYYAEDRISWGGGSGAVGDIYHSGTSLYSSGNTTNASMDFNADSACILKTVKVLTDMAGVRRFVLLDNGGNIVDSLSVNIPVDSTVVTLNFNIPMGTGYSLTTDATVNNANLGFNAPRFQRSNTPGTGNYPYVLNGIATLTGNNQNNGYYYYFYDMHFEKPVYTCLSDRVAVTAHTAGDGINTLNDSYTIQIFPNPSEGLFNLQTIFNYTQLEVTDMLGRKIMNTQGKMNAIDLSSFAKGSYVLILTDKNNNSVRRQLVIQ